MNGCASSEVNMAKGDSNGTVPCPHMSRTYFRSLLVFKRSSIIPRMRPLRIINARPYHVRACEATLGNRRCKAEICPGFCFIWKPQRAWGVAIASIYVWFVHETNITLFYDWPLIIWSAISEDAVLWHRKIVHTSFHYRESITIVIDSKILCPDTSQFVHCFSSRQCA